jgi:uncharacterized protein
MRSYAEDTSAAGRQVLPDLVRAWALFGICVVNVGVLSWPTMSSYHYPGGMETGADKAAFWAVNSLFLMKSYSLFSLMFGVGFAYQMESAARKGVGFAGRYWRRIIGLLAFGILNIVCLFFGDILVLYAVLGALFFLFRNKTEKALWRWGIGFYAVQVLLIAFFAVSIWAGMTYAPEDMGEMIADFEATDAASLAAFGSGSFVEAATYRATSYLEDGIFMFLFQGWGAFAFFLIGFALVKSGAIADPTAAVWKRSRHLFLPLGLLISGLGGWMMVTGEGMGDPTMMWGMLLVTIGSPFSTFGYLGLIAKFAQGPGGPVRTFLARGGTASLTAYLMQNLILSLIFHAYGLDLFAQVPAAQAIAIAAGVALFTIGFASVWRLFFARGPLEYILRGWTYLGAR